MRQKATRSEASGAIVEYMGAIAGVRPKPHGAIDFYSLGEGSFLYDREAGENTAGGREEDEKKCGAEYAMLHGKRRKIPYAASHSQKERCEQG